VEFLQKCLASLLHKTAYPDFEVLLVDNHSHQAATRDYYESLAADARVQILRYGPDFNYSAANNYGARRATGDMLLFLNNDVEALEADWLEEMVRWAERPEIGAVGAKLLFPNGAVQHAGVIIGLEGHGSHVFWGCAEDQSGPFGSVNWYRNYSAVTGACLMMRREVFEAVGGFDEEYRLVFSDIELCVRIANHGYRIVYTPFSRLRHHEGRTRETFIPGHDISRAYAHLEHIVESGDPYYNPNLSYTLKVPTLSGRNEENRIDRLQRIVRLHHLSG
jgi:GT2 family glycosyltransferase